MKHLHNLCQYFVKDSGAHFTYNIGVGFMRAGLIMLAITIVLRLFAAVQPNRTLDYVDSVKAEVTDANVSEHTTHTRGHRRTYLVYTVSFSGSFSNGDKFTHKQYADKELYKMYSRLVKRGEKSYTLYKSRSGGGYYITEKKGYAAAKEYRKAVPGVTEGLSSMAAVGALIVTTVLFSIGMREIKIAMKYPRTDVPYDTTDLAVKDDTDELLNEFDEAYKVFMERKKMGLDASAPAAPRLAKNDSNKQNGN